MKQFSAVWYLCSFLKMMAVYFALAAAFNVLTAFPTDNDSATVSILGVPLVIGRAVHMMMTAVWMLLSGLTTSAALIALSELLRIAANTEAFARATYSMSRKRPAVVRTPHSEETVQMIVPHRREQPITPPIFEMREPSATDLQFSPPERYRRQQLRAQGAPARRVTVFRNRSDNVVHEPRPAGHVEAVDWLDASAADFRRIPFDKV